MTAESVSPPLAAGGGGGGLSPDVMGAAGCGTCCTAASVGGGTGDRNAGSESAVAVCSCHLAAAASLPPHYASHRSTPATTAVYAPYPSTDQNPYPSIDTSSFYPHLVSFKTMLNKKSSDFVIILGISDAKLRGEVFCTPNPFRLQCSSLININKVTEFVHYHWFKDSNLDKNKKA